MKKFLLFAAAIAMTSSGFANPGSPKLVKAPTTDFIAATKTVRYGAPAKSDAKATTFFTYAGEPKSMYSLNGVNQKSFVYQAVEFTVSDQEQFIGNEISAVYVYTPNSNGHNPIEKGIAFVTDDLTKMPKFSINDMPSEGGVEARLELNEPVEITGEKSLYFGFRFLYTASCTYITVDEQPNNENRALIGVGAKATTIPEYANYAPQIGNLCISIEIKGDNLPANNALIKRLDIKDKIDPGEFNYTLNIMNLGSNPISNLSVESSYAGYTTTRKITLDSEIAPGEYGEVSVGPLPAIESISQLTATLLKVNGDEVSSKSVTKPYSCYSSTLPRKLVIEEGTGTWCQYCPLGILMMEYIKEKYPDWIRIAVHNGDRMSIDAYQPVINAMGGSLPSALTNRAVMTPPQYVPDYHFFDLVYNQLSPVPTYVAIDTDAEATADRIVNVTVKTKFDINCDAPHGICVVTVEDGVGPYNQSNYYAGAGEEYGLWGEEGKNTVSTIYEDVARNINKYPADETAYSGAIVKGQDYTYTTSMDVANIKSHEFRLVAMVVNLATGEIVNAQEIVVDNSADICSISENETEATYYSFDGRIVNSANLSSGIYIEKKSGKTRKILVR